MPPVTPDPITKRKAVVIAGLVLFSLPPVMLLWGMGGYLLPIGGYSGNKAQIAWSVVGVMVSMVFPLVLLIGYLLRPKSLERAYWVLPVYFALWGLDTLVDAVGYQFLSVRGPTSGYFLYARLLWQGIPILFALLLWLYRPRPQNTPPPFDEPVEDALAPTKVA